ncbi:serine/threonine protein kinase [Streptomyces sp. KLOTTS4A1]|uniref:serine/threonine protein kinase n=1 Tax=Streptomyces sp. KLOTTS4A1 TaxID=3390996 RepID=UPI0039F4FCAB
MTGRFAALDEDDPKTVGGYALRARIGVGGMGRVYLAFSPGGRPLAVKVVRPDYAHDPEFRRRFKREIKAARSVEGLYTAPVVDADSEARLPWLATAYVPGPSLSQAVAEHGPLPRPTVFRLIAGVAEGLMAVHARGLVHRDLKPANILLADDGPRVIDFGIAHAASATAATVTGLRIGTPAYMAPEQVRGRSAGPPADVFALGNLAVYAATGRAAFGEGNAEALFYRILHEEPELDACPESLRELLGRCLAKDPAERPDLARILSYAAEHTANDPLDPARGWLPAPVVGTLAAYDTAMYRTPGQAGEPGNPEQPEQPEQPEPSGQHSATATTEQRPAPKPTRKLPDGETPPEAEPKAEARAESKTVPKAVIRVDNTTQVTVRILSEDQLVGRLGPGERKDFGLAPGPRSLRLTAPGHQDTTRIYGLRSLGMTKLEVSSSQGQLFLERPGVGPGRQPGADPGRKPGGGGDPGGKRAVLAAVSLALVLLAAIVFSEVSGSGDRDRDNAGSSSDPTVTASTDAPGTATDGKDHGTGGTATTRTSSPEETEEPTPSAEDRAFAAVDVGDCLSNRYDYHDDTEWKASMPRVASCSRTDSYYRVAAVGDSYGDCEDDDENWYNRGEDGSRTNLCLIRNYRTGQCMYAKAKGERLTVYRNEVTGCRDSIPKERGYIVRITRVFPNGAPENACGDDRVWRPDKGGHYCGKAVWKRKSLPSI